MHIPSTGHTSSPAPVTLTGSATGTGRRWARYRRRTCTIAALIGCVFAGIAIVGVLGSGCQPPALPPHPAGGVPQGVPGVSDLLDVVHDNGLTCGQYRVLVSAAPGSTALTDMWTQLCTRGSFAGKPAEVDLPDLGYDHTSYTWPQPSYNYTHAVGADRVTLTLDLLGTGDQSAHPDGRTAGYLTQAWIVHQLVMDLHLGLFGNPTYQNVFEVGSGAGAGIAWMETGGWHDVAGLVLLAATHQMQLPTSQIRPAGTDPRFAGLDWAARGYQAIRAGARCGLGYDPYGADRQVCDLDERLNADTAIPQALVTGWSTATDSPVTGQITVPVLVVIGSSDQSVCGPDGCRSATEVLQTECGRYRRAPSCQGWVQPDAGHQLLLHRSLPLLVDEITRWQHQVAPASRSSSPVPHKAGTSS